MRPRNSVRATRFVIFSLAIVAILVTGAYVWQNASRAGGSVRSPAIGSSDLPDTDTNEERARRSSELARFATRQTSSRPPDSFDLESYLKSQRDNPAALWALFIQYRSAEYLDALKKRAEVDPNAAFLYSMVGVTLAMPLDQRLQFLRQASERFAGDGRLRFCLAATIAEGGDFYAAALELSIAARCQPEGLGERERQEAMRSLFERTGVNSDQAWRDAYRKDFDVSSSMGFLTNQLINTARWSVQSAPDAASQVISDILTVTNHLNPTNDYASISDRTVRAAQMQVLKSVPPETLFGEDGMTVDDYRKQLAASYFDDLPRADWINDFVSSSSAATARKFLEIREAEGTDAAYNWATSLAGRK